MAKATRNNQPPKGGGNENVQIARVAMWQAIVVALITTLGGGIIGYFTAKAANQNKEPAKNSIQVFVPNQQASVVKDLPIETNSDKYKLIKDISIFDLREWKHTPDSLKNSRFSPANYTNYLHVKKIKEIDKIIIHYATSGYGIDMRCITSSYNFYQKQKPIFHDNKSTKEYALEVNVTGIPIDKEFLIVVEGTYWNGFNNDTLEDASTYTDTEIHGLDELGLIVFLPDSKPFKEYELLDRDNQSGVEDTYRGDNAFYGDKNKKFIYWSIKERLPDHHYRLKWTW